jgi:hypothetical protein
MKTAWTVAAREFESKKNVLWAGFAAALLAFLSPLVPGASRVDPAEVRAFVVLFLASSLAVGSAILVGSTMFGTDLAEKRASWYFSRPIPPTSLWWGKLAGGMAVVLLATTAAAVPALIGGRLRIITVVFTQPIDAAVFLALATVLVFSLIVLGNAVSVALRSHSLWLLLDAAGLAVTGSLLWIVARLLLRAGATWAWATCGIVMAGVAIVALVLAGWRQVSAGRIDPKASHRELSTTLWAIVGASAALCAAWALWATSYSPSDIVKPWIALPSSGRWLVAEGWVRGRGESFPGVVLTDSGSGRFVRLSPLYTVSLSRDGKRAAWAEPDGARHWDPATVMTLDLEDPSARPVASKIVVSNRKELLGLVLSPDGSRAALIVGDNLAVHDVATGAILASARFPEMGAKGRNVFFESPSVLKIYSSYVSDSQSSGIWRFDVGAKRLEKTGAIDCSGAKATFLRLSPTGDRFLVGSGKAGFRLVDGLDGHHLTTLAPAEEGTGILRALFLSDGRVAVGTNDKGLATLRFFSREGLPERAVPLGPATNLRLGGEISPGRPTAVLASGPPANQAQRFGRVVSVDSATGAVGEIGNDLSHATWLLPWTVLSDSPNLSPGSLGTRLFRSRDDRLQLLDPATGRLAPFSLGGR